MKATEAAENRIQHLYLHNYKIEAEGVKKKVIYQFSDVHLTEYDHLSDEKEKESAISLTQLWNKQRLVFADNHGEPYNKDELQTARTYFAELLAVANEGDALVMAGDICHDLSGANLRALEADMKNLQIPYMYVLGNHESIDDIPDGHLLEKAKEPVQILELEDMLIFGLDNSLQTVTKAQNEALKNALLGEKPLLIVMHSPITTEGNKADIDRYGGHFRFNYEGAPEEVFEFVHKQLGNCARFDAVCFLSGRAGQHKPLRNRNLSRHPLPQTEASARQFLAEAFSFCSAPSRRLLTPALQKTYYGRNRKREILP